MADSNIHHNPDPALEPSHQHHHQHHHHSPRVDTPGHDDPVYTTGTTDAPSVVPPQRHSHEKEKTGAHTPPDYSDHEKHEAGVVDESARANSHSDAPAVIGWRRRLGPVYRYRRPIIHLFIFCLFTGWWIASLVLHRNDKNWVVPFLLWLAITLRLIFFHVPSRHVSNVIKKVWLNTAVRIYDLIPANLRTLAGATVTVAAILIGAFVSEEVADNTRENRAVSLFGMAVFLFILWATSKDRKRINWRTVIGGMLTQYVIGLFVLRTTVGYDIFRFIADRAADLLGFAKAGVAFLTSEDWFIVKFATFVFWGLGVSGAEAVVAAATPFIGQGESAMLVRPFVPHMTKAELHQIMTCGFATISGSVLVGYIGLGLNREALVSSCIMSIPASLAISKMRYPETEETLTAGRVVIPDDDEHKAENALHAFANGAWLGIKIAGTIVCSLLCIIALVAFINGLLTWWGRYLNINDPTPLTLQLILGYLLFPVSFLLGVSRTNGTNKTGDILPVAKLIAEKIITNEYKAFSLLTNPSPKDNEFYGLSPRSQLIATYALCGFGNIGSLGIQIGILSQLAPSRGGDVAKLAVSALISGVLATLTSASVAGLVVTNQLSSFGQNASS
ncbi:hypothetical protein ACJA88_003624 [Fusarium oxysporum]